MDTLKQVSELLVGWRYYSSNVDILKREGNIILIRNGDHKPGTFVRIQFRVRELSEIKGRVRSESFE